MESTWIEGLTVLVLVAIVASLGVVILGRNLGRYWNGLGAALESVPGLAEPAPPREDQPPP